MPTKTTNAAAPVTNKTSLWQKLLRPEHGDLPQAAAQFFLRLTFDQADRQRMHELAVKNQEGTLTAAEAAELDEYVHAGLVLDLLRAKARRSLQEQGA
jgi:hypothetical protein